MGAKWTRVCYVPNYLGEIKDMMNTDVEAADHSLHALYRELKEAPDGTGEFILNGERHLKYLDLKDEP